MATDLVDAVVGFFAGDSEVGADPTVTVQLANGQRKTMRRSQAASFIKKNRGAHIMTTTSRRSQAQRPAGYPQAQRPGYGQAQYSQPGYPPQMQAQPIGYPQGPQGYPQPGYPQYPQQPGYPPQGGYGPQEYYPQEGSYQQPSSQPQYVEQPQPFDDSEPAEDVFPDGSLGVAAAVGEAHGDPVVGTEQYAQVGGYNPKRDVSRYLVFPWSAATADEAHRTITAAGLGDGDAKWRVATLKRMSGSGNPNAKKALGMMNSVAKLVLQGRPVPSQIALTTPGMVVAVPAVVTVQQRQAQTIANLQRSQRQQMAQMQAQQARGISARSAAEARINVRRGEQAEARAQIDELTKQLERRDWSDETRRQLEAQRADFEARLASMVTPGGGTAAAAPAELDELSPEDVIAEDAEPSDRGDFDAGESDNA